MTAERWGEKEVVKRVARMFVRDATAYKFCARGTNYITICKIKEPLGPICDCRCGCTCKLCLNLSQALQLLKTKIKTLKVTSVSETPEIFDRASVGLKLSRLRPFVLLLRATCRWRWVWKELNRRWTAVLLLAIYPPQILHGLAGDRTCTSSVRT